MQYHIDSHKLHLHPRAVADWLEGKDIAPIYLEISPSGGCNHRCRFCGMDFLGYKNRFLPLDATCTALHGMGKAGVKAIMFAGEGEPLLHPGITRMATEAYAAGIDIAFTTNGVLLTPEKAEHLLPIASWIKISCNAGTPQGYEAVHQAPPGDFARLVQHLEKAVRIRERQKSTCSIGMQMLMLEDNADEILPFCRLAASLGVDYAVLKPYSGHTQSPHPGLKNISIAQCQELASEWQALVRDDFKIVMRMETLARIEEEQQAYPYCRALPFWGYIDSGGTFWGCLRHIGNPRFNYGNILQQDFGTLLHSEERRHKIALNEKELDIHLCRSGCRMDAVNRYLHTLREPDAHINFI